MRSIYRCRKEKGYCSRFRHEPMAQKYRCHSSNSKVARLIVRSSSCLLFDKHRGNQSRVCISIDDKRIATRGLSISPACPISVLRLIAIPSRIHIPKPHSNHVGPNEQPRKHQVGRHQDDFGGREPHSIQPGTLKLFLQRAAANHADMHRRRVLVI
jgi:hypothetical protein